MLMNKLNHVDGRVIVRVGLDDKNSYKFKNGVVIRLERDRNDFDKKYTTISQGIVISSDYAPIGSTIYFHHNGTREENKIYNYNNLNAEEIANQIYYFSIPEHDCYLFRVGDGSIQPFKGFATALRVFVPYSGIIHGVEPKKMKDTLYVTSGEYKGVVVRTLRSCDYELVINGPDGREERYIRIRHFEDQEDAEREEIIAIDHGATKKVKGGSLLVGLTPFDAEPIKSTTNA